VILNGLQPPQIVTDATSELLEENDLTKQFREDLLMDSAGSTVSRDAMGGGIQKWLGGSRLGWAIHPLNSE
jgi:hypothetical protein